MFIQEAVAFTIMTVVLLTALAGITSMVLSHRQEMARIKYGSGKKDDDGPVESDDLKETVSLMQDRLIVLEQIATDPARRTAEEIEKLR